MTRSERAAQIWPLLCFCASHRQTVTYEVLARLTGMAQQFELSENPMLDLNHVGPLLYFGMQRFLRT